MIELQPRPRPVSPLAGAWGKKVASTYTCGGDHRSGSERLGFQKGHLPTATGLVHSGTRWLALALFLIAVPAQAEVIGGRPAGCPARYCGCASAIKVGLPNRDGRWNLARNWFRFPRAEPGPGMAEVRRNHVRIIIGGSHGAWQFYDPNSGRGLTRIVTGPIRGTVVNPNKQWAMR